ncbi:alpha/beta hydrolase [Mycolicibacterium komossense]|uniref:Alpha/beta hydrolase n=1 Tax=Mycolicibacterium komossense TaxID=1779 RepID=A0ABT3C6X7_9MYCO|nr:alpha/beta hydrolase [Mycolicibacterium komossense]MCV7225218.1 alpha/beta hydrolase [Mycolicibacterium komossense]
MTRPTVTQARQWRPERLREVADAWDDAAGHLQTEVDELRRSADEGRDGWAGTAAATGWERLASAQMAATAMTRGFVAAAVAARDGAARIAAARDEVLAVLSDADGYRVADDGTVAPPDGDAAPLLRLTSGGDERVAQLMMAMRATELTDLLRTALDRLGAADTETAHDIDQAFDVRAAATDQGPAHTRPAGVGPVADAAIVAAWPSMSQDRIAGQIAAMTPAQRQHLIDTMPAQVGNTDGAPWEMRIAANRINIADAILDQRRTIDRPDDDKLRRVLGQAIAAQHLDPASAERMWVAAHADAGLRAAAIGAHDADARRHIAFYQGLLAEVPDPGRREGPASESMRPRQILAFDPARASLVELIGDLHSATSVGVLVPGLNTTIIGSAGTTETARRFVAAGRGSVAMITYLGGPFPTGGPVTGLLNAAEPRFALEMAPRLVAFSEDVERTLAGTETTTGQRIPVTFIGHSYGGSILGTAESLGLTADRTLYVEAAGAGVGVHDPGDWHNRNPHVLRFSMTAPGDPIEAVQGFPTGPHGADPDEMPGVIRLDTGHRLDGTVMSGLAAHSDVLSEPSDAWRNILGVITGDRGLIQVR